MVKPGRLGVCTVHWTIETGLVIPWTGTPRTRTRVRRQEAVRAGPGPGPAHTKCMGVMGVGVFWRIWSENGPVYLFGVIFVYKILENFRMGGGSDSFPQAK